MGATANDVLIEARSLIAQGYCKYQAREYTIELNGRHKACGWCPTAAVDDAALQLARFASTESYPLARAAIGHLVEARGGHSVGERLDRDRVITWSDDPETSHDEILKTFDEAIRRSKQ